MENLKYHSKLHPWVGLYELGQVKLTWSRHALYQAKTKNILKVFEVTINEGDVFEIEVLADGTHKYGCRIPYSDKDDLILILVSEGLGDLYKVVTTWLNATTDGHATLDATQYCPAYEGAI